MTFLLYLRCLRDGSARRRQYEVWQSGKKHHVAMDNCKQQKVQSYQNQTALHIASVKNLSPVVWCALMHCFAPYLLS